jgi:hypothetical protein
MRVKMFLTTLSVLSLLFSASVSAHITEPGGALPHFLTGEHLLTVIIVAVCIAGIRKIYRRLS